MKAPDEILATRLYSPSEIAARWRVSVRSVRDHAYLRPRTRWVTPRTPRYSGADVLAAEAEAVARGEGLAREVAG